MRTTLSIDDDLQVELRLLQARSGRTWKQVVNDVIRAGMRALDDKRQAATAPSTTQPVHLGRPRVGDISNVHEVLSLAEGDARA